MPTIEANDLATAGSVSRVRTQWRFWELQLLFCFCPTRWIPTDVMLDFYSFSMPTGFSLPCDLCQ